MLITSITTALLLAISGLAQARSGGYIQTCNPGSMKGSLLVGTNCGDGRGGYNRGSSLDLNTCLGNINGNLVFLPNGGFGGSCRNFQVSIGGKLSADCGNGKGGWPRTTIDLNTIVGNSGGNLVC